MNDLAFRHVYESTSVAVRAAIEEFLASRFCLEERARALSDAEKVLTGVITRGMDGKD